MFLNKKNIEDNKKVVNMKEVCKSMGMPDTNMILPLNPNVEVFALPKTLESLVEVKEDNKNCTLCFKDGTNYPLVKGKGMVQIFGQASLLDTLNIEEFTNGNSISFLYYYIYATMYAMGIRSKLPIKDTTIIIKSQATVPVVTFQMKGASDYVVYNYESCEVKVKGSTTKSFKFLGVFGPLVDLLDTQWDINSTLILAPGTDETLKANHKNGTTIRHYNVDYKSLFLQFPIELRPFALNNYHYVMWMCETTGIKATFYA